jgi:rhodanese-related sulfurtransferase
MRVLVCGGRDYSDREMLYEVLDRLHSEESTRITSIISGMARGADSLAAEWAHNHFPDVNLEEFPAQWHIHGKSAGPIRNQQMLDSDPDLIIACPGGRGTAHMVSIARARGYSVESNTLLFV